jgi:hypothetical protein
MASIIVRRGVINNMGHGHVVMYVGMKFGRIIIKTIFMVLVGLS